jgi:hypothetical protein
MGRARTAGAVENQMSCGEKIEKALIGGGLLFLSLVVLSGTANAQIAHNDEFVQRDGSRLTLGGETFRYSGANIEWLGLEGYGPMDAAGPRYPSHFEVDDALDTAKAMGARVIRSQTLGDSIGCELCIEPKVGEFNPQAFKSIDYALKAAHDRGLRLIFTLTGDCSDCALSGNGEYFKEKGIAGESAFFTDPAIIAKFEKHIAAVLNHTNSLTGIQYKDDPTIMAWENCNGCGAMVGILDPAQTLPPLIPWIDTIGKFIKSIDKKHLYQDNSGLFLYEKSGVALDAKTSDIVPTSYYPHWDALFTAGDKSTTQTFSKHAALVTGKGKVFTVDEYGWDPTDWATPGDLQAALTAFESDPKISGDLFWALQAHVDKYGWQPIPANVPSEGYSKMGESGQWWALYYGGMKTLIVTHDDMRARAELLRTHAFKMAGLPVPAHAIPPAPVVTSKGMGLLAWRGSAGAVNYSIERRDTESSPWVKICDRCVTDEDTPWIDSKPAPGIFTAQYRITAYNADGAASAPSAVR